MQMTAEKLAIKTKPGEESKNKNTKLELLMLKLS